MVYNRDKGLVLMSGGLDSAITLLHAMEAHVNTVCLAFDYGQRNLKELRAAKRIANFNHSEFLKHPITLSHVTSGLLQPGGTIDPETAFVPGRNITFLVHAIQVAHNLGLHDIWTGVSETDDTVVYPDCRLDTIRALELTMGLALDYKLIIHTPMMLVSKADAVSDAYSRSDRWWDTIARSWSCYTNNPKPCGKCPACLSRQKAFAEFKHYDPAGT